MADPQSPDLVAFQKRFPTDAKCREYFERIRWPDGPTCPHCGCFGRIWTIRGQSARSGLRQCGDCKRQFTVTVGTVFEATKVGLEKWFLAAYLLTKFRKGISSLQLSGMLGVARRTAWFMAQRLRLAMRVLSFDDLLHGIIEADETYIGGRPRRPFKNRQPDKPRKKTDKITVMVVLERSGRARTRVLEGKGSDSSSLKAAIFANVDRAAIINTDEAKGYSGLDKDFGDHWTVNHSKYEFARDAATTNSAESYFAVFKRGFRGVYHRLSRPHMQRYADEFAFRWTHRRSPLMFALDALLIGSLERRLKYMRVSTARPRRPVEFTEYRRPKNVLRDSLKAELAQQ